MHVRELVLPSLPHAYAYEDSSALGAGGVWLPCTLGFSPVVWRFPYPPDVIKSLSNPLDYTVTNSDGEMAASLLQFDALEQAVGRLRLLATVTGSDNTATVHWQEKQAAKTSAPTPAWLCRLMAQIF